MIEVNVELRGGEYLQSSKREHDHKDNFLLLGYINCNQCRNWNDQDGEVGSDMHAGI